VREATIAVLSVVGERRKTMDVTHETTWEDAHAPEPEPDEPQPPMTEEEERAGLEHWRKAIESGNWPTISGQLFLFDVIARRDKQIEKLRGLAGAVEGAWPQIDLAADTAAAEGFPNNARRLRAVLTAYMDFKDPIE
jgi:hypothetical protein